MIAPDAVAASALTSLEVVLLGFATFLYLVVGIQDARAAEPGHHRIVLILAWLPMLVIGLVVLAALWLYAYVFWEKVP